MQFRLDVGKAVLAGEPARRAGRRIGGDRESVPAPEVALLGHQPLAGLEQLQEPRRVGAFDHADLRDATRQLLRRLDVLAQRIDTLGQLRVVWLDRGAGPAHGRGGVNRRFQIVAERRTKRRLVTLVDRDVVDHRRPQTLGVDVEQLRQGLGFGVEPLRSALGLGQRRARDIERLPRRRMRSLGAHGCRLGVGDRGLSSLGGTRELGDIRQTLAGLAELREFPLHARQLVTQPPPPLVLRAQRAFELIAPRRQVGERAGQLGKGLFRRRERSVGFGHAPIGAAALLGIRGSVPPQRFLFAGKARQRGLRIGSELALALDVGCELDEPLVELGHAVPGARLLLLKRLAGDHQPLQRGGGPGLGLAQRRHVGCCRRSSGGSLRLRAGALGDHAHGLVLGLSGLGQFGIGADPAQMEQRRLRGAHLRRDIAIAHRLPRLGLERRHLGGELPDHVLQPLQIVLRRA